MGGARFSSCDLRTFGEGGSHLSLEGLETLPSLHQLLSELLPAGVTLAGGGLSLELGPQLPAEAADLAIWRSPHLAALAEVELGGGLEEALPFWVLEALLAQIPQLRRLHIEFYDVAVLPACIIGKTGLHTLEVKGCQLADLPPGPYLSTLHTLSLWDDNAFTRLPTALAAATALRELNIDSMHMFLERP